MDANLVGYYADVGKSWPDASYQFPQIDHGRVTWTRFEPIDWFRRYHDTRFDDAGKVLRSVPVGEEGYRIPASSIGMPAFSHDAIPLHMTTICYSDLTDGVPGFEGFLGNQGTSVYFAEGLLTGLIKIGIASDVRLRLSGLRTSSPEPVQMLGDYPHGTRQFESFLHGLFEPLRHHGEWFYPHWSIYSVIAGGEF